jgi:hypothetical protein
LRLHFGRTDADEHQGVDESKEIAEDADKDIQISLVDGNDGVYEEEVPDDPNLL